jgi:beta-lactamase class A
MNLQPLKRQVNSILSAVPAEYGFVIKNDIEMIQSNEKIKIPAASIIKIPIMMEAFRQIETGKLNPSERVQLTADKKVGGSGVLRSFSEDVSLPFIDMLKLMITVSDNTASNAVLRKVGMSQVNQLCDSLGCTDTRVERYLMDMKAKNEGKDNTTSPKDMLTILENMSTRSTHKEKMLSILEGQQFNHKLAAYAYDATDQLKIAHKTGELPGVEHDVGLFQYKGQTVYVVVMLNELEDNVVGQQAIAKVGKLVMEYLVGEKN